MTRSRNIKPGFYSNEELVDCQPLARILFTGLWCLADREGRLEDRPKKIKVQILPYDQCDVDALLSELSDKGFILRYAAKGGNFIHINNFLKHQKPHHMEVPSVIPAPPKIIAQIGDKNETKKITFVDQKDIRHQAVIEPTSTRDQLDERAFYTTDSLNLNPDSLNLNPFKERKTKKERNELPEWILAKPWKDFLEMRKKIGKPLTDAGIPLAIKKLEKLKNAGHDPSEVLNQSTFNSWQGLFEIKENGQAGSNQGFNSTGSNRKAGQSGFYNRPTDIERAATAYAEGVADIERKYGVSLAEPEAIGETGENDS